MNKKVFIIFLILLFCILMAGPVFAKQKVKVKISADESITPGKGYICIKLLDKFGREIRSSGMVNYTVSDKEGNYWWVYKEYDHGIREKYVGGKYKVKVKFFGDDYFKKTKKVKKIKVKAYHSHSFDPYNYYDNHNWGLNQRIDDYIEDGYWDEEIYDDASDYDGEGY